MAGKEVFDEWWSALEELTEARTRLAHINSEIQKTKDALAEVEAQIYLAVSQMKDENGKPVYSNESLRQRAAILRMSSDERYTALRSVLRRYESEREHLIAKISNLKDRIDYFKYLVGGGE